MLIADYQKNRDTTFEILIAFKIEVFAEFEPKRRRVWLLCKQFFEKGKKRSTEIALKNPDPTSSLQTVNT